MAKGDQVIAQLSALIRSPRPVNPADELCSAVAGGAGLIRFKAQFLGVADDSAPLNLGIAELRASEARAAIWEAISMAWPPKAIGFRLLDVRNQIVGK
jgi:hypothetical protein